LCRAPISKYYCRLYYVFKFERGPEICIIISFAKRIIIFHCDSSSVDRFRIKMLMFPWHSSVYGPCQVRVRTLFSLVVKSFKFEGFIFTRVLRAPRNVCPWILRIKMTVAVMVACLILLLTNARRLNIKRINYCVIVTRVRPVYKSRLGVSRFVMFR